MTFYTKCVIIKTLREKKQPERKGSPREQVRLSRQRLSLARCVGLRVINVSQSPEAEEMWDYADYKAKSKWASRLSSSSYGAKLNEGFESPHAYQLLLKNIVGENRAEKSALFFLPNTLKVLEPTL